MSQYKRIQKVGDTLRDFRVGAYTMRSQSARIGGAWVFQQTGFATWILPHHGPGVVVRSNGNQVWIGRAGALPREGREISVREFLCNPGLYVA